MDGVFASRLKALRLSRCLTLRNVGDAVGCSLKTICNMENSHKSPSLSMALALANLFDVSLDYLFGRADKKFEEINYVQKEIRGRGETEPAMFAARLRELRLSRRLTLRNVGDAVGCHLKSVANLEKAHKAPSIGMILALADFFGVSVDYLVGWTDYKPDADDSGGETDSPSSPTDTERKKLVELFEDLRGEDIDKVLDYIDFLRYGQQRGNRKEQKR